MSKESGAISLLKRAVELDGKKQWTSALVCYKEGLQMLMEVKKFIKASMRKLGTPNAYYSLLQSFDLF